jgi:hypothetical protein
MWENNLCCISPKLVRILYIGVNPSILLPAPTCQRGSLRSSSIKNWEVQRKKCALLVGNWKDDEWLPEHMIHYYGPVTWAQDGSLRNHIPIYMLNSIIRLQAVVEIKTNEATRALNLLAKQSTKMHNAIYQSRLALGYLLFLRWEFVENLT